MTKHDTRKPYLHHPARRSCVALIAILPLVASASAAHAAAAHQARTLKATDTAKLRYIKHSGSVLIEEGTAHGNFPGTMRARCVIGATFTATFTVYTHYGTLTGHGTATPHGSGLYESFGGTLTITSGTGRYAHAHGHAGLYGTFDRRTYAIILQTTGSLSY